MRLIPCGLVTALACGSVALTAATQTATASPPRPMCIYAATPGGSGFMSDLKCLKHEGSAEYAAAQWDLALSSITSPSGDEVAARTGSSEITDSSGATQSGDIWTFDPAQVSFADLKRELTETIGYTRVFQTGPAGAIEADFVKPSKAKH